MKVHQRSGTVTHSRWFSSHAEVGRPVVELGGRVNVVDGLRCALLCHAVPALAR